MRLETERLILRELTNDDFAAWYEILSDAETMQFYPAPFDEEKVRQWLSWNLENYQTYGFGLWAVILKEENRFIGDCGITMQYIHGQMLPEIGYHIHRNEQGRGYASEAARRCIRYAFEERNLPAVYSYMKYDNLASCCVAQKNGMQLVETYPDDRNTFTRVYAITREEWLTRHVSAPNE